MTEPPTKDTAIEALGELGLSKYEAAVFIALQQLHTGTASDIDRITGVPRSQVYGAADRLNELGVIEIQQSNPIQYRAIDPDIARKRLRERLANQEETAFEYLDAVQGEHAASEATQVDVWTITGGSTINDRINALVEQATDRILFGAPTPEMVGESIRQSLNAAAASVSVTVISESQTVCNQFDCPSIESHCIDDDVLVTPSDHHGRALIVDSDTILLSTRSESTTDDSEAAVWSTNTTFGAVFVDLFDDWMDQYLQ